MADLKNQNDQLMIVNLVEDSVRAHSRAPAFTLIELLIVVGIIALLAAIGLPNFLEAQTRAKIARERADLMTLAVALEAYRVDNQNYPPHGEILSDGTVLFPAFRAGLGTVEFTPGWPLTTPLAYLTSLPADPLLREWPAPLDRRYGYIHSRQMAAILTGRGFIASAHAIVPTYGYWRLYGAGPDGDKGSDAKTGILYDPTNGTSSDGDLVRSQRRPTETLSQDER
jgi:prepilin-type N-terminal cleavage/methylation domain-containing protein